MTEAMIREVVHGFYARIRADEVLAPIFSREIATDAWDPHLAKMCDFWSSVLLMTGRFRGAPMATHARIEGIESTHFARWLGLFRATAEDLCPPQAAALFVARSEMIAESLQLGIDVARGRLPGVARS